MAEIDFDTFSRKLTGASNHLRAGGATIAQRGADSLASDVARAYRVASGGDGKLSGTGTARRGTGKAAPVGAKAKPDVRRYHDDGTFVGLVVPTGAYGLLERKIEPHRIEVYRWSDSRVRRTLKAARKQAYAGGRSAVFATRLARAGLAARTSTALRIPGSKNGYAMSAKHPGTKGQDIFSSAVVAHGGKVVDRMLAESTGRIVEGYKR